MNIRDIMLKRESLYSEYATFDNESIHLEKYVPDIRPSFSRDVDRIIHSKTYTRYMDKTQVFTNQHSDHISKRMTHVQLVSKIARTIGRALSLNEDLIEAIALGHDLGHTPYGHVGEHILDEISQKHGEGNFLHNVQSVRVLMTLEKKNVSVQVLDGILCHNGEFVMSEYYPNKKTTDDFLNEYSKCYHNKEIANGLRPMTLEGCVVRISDVIGYLGRDIEDAESLGLFCKTKLPTKITDVVGKNNKEIINNIILDVIENSFEKPYIKLSDKMYKAIKDLKSFNYEHIYLPANSKEEVENYRKMFNTLFEKSLSFLKNGNKKQNIYKFINEKDEDYIKNTTPERKVIDFIAGMTDDYFLKEYKKIKDL